MIKLINYSFLILLLLQPNLSYTQNQKNIDSLRQKLQQQIDDTVRVDILNTLGWEYRNQDQDKARDFFKQGRSLAIKIAYSKGEATSYNSEAVIFWTEGDLLTASKLYDRALKIYREIKFEKGITSVLTNVGLIKMNQGEYSEAMKLFIECGELEQKRNDKQAYAGTLNNIANIYYYQRLFKKSVEVMLQAKKLHEETGGYDEAAKCLSNVGVISLELGDTTKALNVLKEAAKIRKEIGDSVGLGITLTTVGTVLSAKRNFDEALNYFKEAQRINNQTRNLDQQAHILNSLGELYGRKNNLPLAISHYVKCLKIAKKLNNRSLIKTVHLNIAEVYERKKDYRAALFEYKIFISYKDTLMNEAQQKLLTELQVKYESESINRENELLKKEQELQLAEKKKKQLEIERIEAENKKQVFMIAGIGILLLAIIIIAIILYRSNQLKAKTNKIITKQKSEVEQHRDKLEQANREILDSITYAKRIQSAILPPDKLVKEYLQNSFILYRPKDIVAGDFYWMEHKDGKVLFAAADCTGHGVPGAMVSVICNNGLNRSVREHGLADPGKILDKTREIVIQEFEKSEEEVKDGMDIALCSLKNNKLEYAGAHNPLWIIRGKSKQKIKTLNGTEVKIFTLDTLDFVLYEVKANKQPIGKFRVETPFTTHHFELQKEDSVYLFSDGYVDQFGGVKGKKFKSINFKKLLLTIQDKSMEEQKTTINNAFENWRGSLEQIDDVCIIGVKIQ